MNYYIIIYKSKKLTSTKKEGEEKMNKYLSKTLSMLLIFCMIVGMGSPIFSSAQKDNFEGLAVEEEENIENEILLEDSKSIEVTFNVTSKWTGHYNVDVTLLNISGMVIEDWEVFFYFKDKIENIWNAKVLDSDDGESVLIHNAGWNQDIGIDKAVTFGMTVACRDEIEFPDECYLTRSLYETDKDSYSIQYIQNSAWDNHVNGQIIITNTGDKKIEDWKISLKTSENIKFENIWNAKLINEDAEGFYQIDNAAYNQNIEPGKSVEFGFIAKCNSFKIEKDSLYSMINVEYENGIFIDDSINENWEYWEPDYDLDDFDTYEEYEEYCKEIKYKSIGRTTYARTRTVKSIEPHVTAEIVSKVSKEKKGYALQSYLWNGDKLHLLFRNAKKKTSAFLGTAGKTSAGYYSLDVGNVLNMKGFSHGQSFERLDIGSKRTFMICSGAKTKRENGKKDKNGWSREVSFVPEKKLLNRTKDFSDKNNCIKKIIGFEYIPHDLGKKLSIKRIDAALSTSEQDVLVVWYTFWNCDKRMIALFDMNKIEKHFIDGNTYFNLKNDQCRNSALILATNESASKLQPNKSFQSIEVSDGYGSKDGKTKKWKIYITSGNTGKGQALTLNRATLSIKKGANPDSGKISEYHQVSVTVPHNASGQPVLTGELELEGCHIKGEELHFLMTRSNKENKEVAPNAKADKVQQFIVGTDKHFE